MPCAKVNVAKFHRATKHGCTDVFNGLYGFGFLFIHPKPRFINSKFIDYYSSSTNAFNLNKCAMYY